MCVTRALRETTDSEMFEPIIENMTKLPACTAKKVKEKKTEEMAIEHLYDG